MFVAIACLGQAGSVVSSFRPCRSWSVTLGCRAWHSNLALVPYALAMKARIALACGLTVIWVGFVAWLAHLANFRRCNWSRIRYAECGPPS
jgi:hypothetical protein